MKRGDCRGHRTNGCHIEYKKDDSYLLHQVHTSKKIISDDAYKHYKNDW
jgi:hypothetical protein